MVLNVLILCLWRDGFWRIVSRYREGYVFGGLHCAVLHRAESGVGEPHFWSEVITSHLFFITVLDNLRRYPWLVNIGKLVLPWVTTAVRDRHSGYTRQQLDRWVSYAAKKYQMLRLQQASEHGISSKGLLVGIDQQG